MFPTPKPGSTPKPALKKPIGDYKKIAKEAIVQCDVQLFQETLKDCLRYHGNGSHVLLKGVLQRLGINTNIIDERSTGTRWAWDKVIDMVELTHLQSYKSPKQEDNNAEVVEASTLPTMKLMRN